MVAVEERSSNGEEGEERAREPSPVARLVTLLNGHVMTQLVASAVRLRIPDHLAAGPVDEGRLGELVGIDLPVLRRYLRALAGIGIVELGSAGAWRTTPMGELLRRDTGPLAGQALLAGAEYYDAWSSLDVALRTGESAFEHRHGSTLWERFADEEVSASFARTMGATSERLLEEILGAYDFGSASLVADIGAGDGSLVAGLLRRYPGLRAVAFEQPAVIEHTRRTIVEHDPTGRCELVRGDFLTGVPEGADLYVLKAVLHNWSDSGASRILANCRAAMPSGGRLLVVERPMRAGDSVDAAITDLTMLVLFGSRDRTLPEYEGLLDEAGFTVERTSIAPSGIAVIVASPRA